MREREGPAYWLVNIAMVLAVVAAALVLFEWWARATGRFVPEDKSRIRAEERLYFLKDDTLGWIGKPKASYKVRGTREDTVVLNNSLGLRDREFAADRPAGTTRIALLGDSFIWGFGTERAEDRFGDVLEELLRRRGLKVEVYNFAIAGWGTDQQYLAYRRIVSAYNPDLVILAYYVNDALDNVTRQGKPYFEIVGDGLELRNVPVSREGEQEWAEEGTMGGLKTFLGTRSYTYRLLRDLTKRSALFFNTMVSLGLLDDPFEGRDPAYLRRLASMLIRRLAEEVKKDGAELMLLFIPDRAEVEGEPMDYVMRRIVEVKDGLAGEDFGVPSLDLTPLLAAEAARSQRPLYQRFDGRHWTVEGNRFVARAVAAFLEERRLAPFSRRESFPPK